MDAFENIRKRAAELHDELMADGADALSSMVLVDAAVHRLGLELSWLPAGDPALKGSRGVFDEQSGAIFCEQVEDPGERAALAAHEVGHAAVHVGSSSCDAADVDASRSTETAPVGLQRVEDYGARERRELQANVFAREFLLPRSFARGLFLTEGLGAADIAQKTGLPKNLIRQQLLDALLLPSSAQAEATDSVGPRPPVPDPSQDRAANYRGAPFQLQAGPGTGKTSTLVKRVLSLLSEGVDPAAILVLTYSNRAAGELAERIGAAAPDAVPRIWIGTLHAFGLDLVRRYHDRLWLPSNPGLFDRSDAIEVLAEILPTLPLVHYRNLWDPEMELREIVVAISRAKDELADPARYRALSQAMLDGSSGDDAQEAAEKCLEVARIYELYEAALRERKAVDFGDLIMRPTMLLDSDDAVRTALQLRHRHVLVDEYQDVNRASARLIRALAGDGDRLWVVGDARQSIYRFRGASSANMASFSRDYPQARIDRLDLNYRSTDQVVKLVRSVAPHMGASAGMLPLMFAAERGPGPSTPEIRRYDTLEDEAAGIAACIVQLQTRGVCYRDQAVLCRTNKRLNEIAAALELRGIPVLHLGSLFERSEVRDLLALMSLAVDPFGEGLARVGALPRYGLTLQDVYLVARQVRAAETPSLQVLQELAELPELSKEGAIGLRRLATDLEGLSGNISAWEFLSAYLLDRSDVVRELANPVSVQARMRAIAVWQFLNFVREQSPVRSGPPMRRTLDRVRQLVLLAEERDLRQVPAAALEMDAVKLMTVHGSKGLEFEAVHVPGLTVQSFPSSYRGSRCPPPLGMIAGAEGLSVDEEARRSHAQEEECLFFVALSRARTHLVLHLARRQPNGHNRNQSPFLDWLPAGLVGEVASPAVMPLPSDAARPEPVKVTPGKEWRVTDSDLALFKRCPRRFFYTRVLGLGSARKRTPFSRTHDCLYELIRWLAEVRRQGEVSPTIEAAEVAFESIWAERGPVDHGFAVDYRQLSSRLIAALISAGIGRRFLQSEPLVIDLAHGRVIVEPSEIAQQPDGTVVLRRVRTGYRRSDEYDRLEYGLYYMAGEANFGAAFAVEAVHLTDNQIDPVPMTPRKLKTRRENSEEMLRSIGSGWFPPEVDAVSCPRCPHFFICPAAPRGALILADVAN